MAVIPAPRPLVDQMINMIVDWSTSGRTRSAWFSKVGLSRILDPTQDRKVVMC